MELSLTAYVVLAAAVATGSYVQTVAGLGLAVLAAPVAAIVEPSLVPGAMLLTSVAMSCLALAGEHEHVDWGVVGWTLPARLPGTAVGVLLVIWLDQRLLGLAIGGMVLLAVLASARAPHVRPTRPLLVGAGFAAGVTTTATSVGGPPVAILLQHRPAAEVRATMAVFFLAGLALSLSGLALAGELTAAIAWTAAALVPWVVVGHIAGRMTRARVPREVFRGLMLAVCAAAAIALIVQSL